MRNFAVEIISDVSFGLSSSLWSSTGTVFLFSLLFMLQFCSRYGPYTSTNENSVL